MLHQSCKSGMQSWYDLNAAKDIGTELFDRTNILACGNSIRVYQPFSSRARPTLQCPSAAILPSSSLTPALVRRQLLKKWSDSHLSFVDWK